MRMAVPRKEAQQPTRIAIAVVRHAGQLLIGQRPDDAELGGLWEFPGGKIQVGESAEAAAVRECAEETGLDVSVQRTLLVEDYRYDHGLLQLHFFDCTTEDAHKPPLAPFHWVARDRLAGYEFPPGNRRVLGLILKS